LKNASPQKPKKAKKNIRKAGEERNVMREKKDRMKLILSQKRSQNKGKERERRRGR